MKRAGLVVFAVHQRQAFEALEQGQQFSRRAEVMRVDLVGAGRVEDPGIAPDLGARVLGLLVRQAAGGQHRAQVGAPGFQHAPGFP